MKFSYIAKTSAGVTQKGVVEAETQSAAASLLRDQSLIPVKIKAQPKGISLSMDLSLGSGVSGGEIATFTRQLATMITAGLPLTDALSLLKNQSSPKLGSIVGAVLLDVQSGVSLSSALEKFPAVFSRVYIALVRAGEAAGVLENILNRLADTAEKSREFTAKVQGALIYPVIILIGMVAVVALMMVVVIPKLTALYADFGAELPLATRIVVGASDFSVKYWWLMIILISIGVYVLRGYINTGLGRRQFDGLIYKIPIFGPLSQKVVLTELTRTLSLLVGAGVSIVEALNIVSTALGNVVMEQEVKLIAKRVERGFPVSISFTESEVFPPIIGQMVAVGEETGKLDDVLAKLSHYFEAESEEKIKGLTAAIEPIILVVLAVGIGFLMYAIVMPIYTITNKI